MDQGGGGAGGGGRRVKMYFAVYPRSSVLRSSALRGRARELSSLDPLKGGRKSLEEQIERTGRKRPPGDIYNTLCRPRNCL